MNKWVKRTSIGLATLALVGVVTAVVGNKMGEQKMARTIALTVAPVEVISDAQHIERGRYLFNTRGCAECHGANGAGKTVMKDGGMLVVAPNITTGANSVTTGYKTVDWVRTLRHGVKPNGNPVMIMPSEDFNRLTDDDTAALIAYVLQMPALPGKSAVIQVPVPVKVLYAFGVIKDASEKIDHNLPPAKAVEAGVTPEHGAYVANACIGCHGEHLSGGKIPGGPPTWPAAANLTPGKGSAMTRYPTPEIFMAMLRSGHRPDGTAVSQVMPFGSLGQMTDTDLRALHAYLLTVPARDAGQR
ncbi:c-type cytochrome [Massilia horti]|uniref:C-type cytochrome n=1 Tax=Massilia horti TaxID=2562153 RepID=A0A4Y9SS35_9BURK|nr:cytochrome c [Massilia horti]TFW29602.1 c-type cytochrome [Massilia horti]